MMALPVEILDQIIDHHKEREAEPPRWYDRGSPVPLKYSKTLLACHMVSKQFRACALRHISISISLYDTPKRLRELQDVIFAEVTSGLGCLASFVKEVDILTIHPKDMPPYGGAIPRKQLKVHKEALLQMLNMVAERIVILKLLISGSERACLDWKFLHSSVRNVLESLLRLPSVAALHLKWIRHLPAQFLATNAHLKSLSVTHCSKIQNLASFAAALPELEQVTMQKLKEFPGGLKFPSLRIVNAQYHGVEELHTSWGVIERASKTLKKIIYNGVGE